MRSIVDGFQAMVWRIVKHDGVNPIAEERIPLADATEAMIVDLLRQKALADLTERERVEVPHLAEPHLDEKNAKRIVIAAGENPHYVASLWRADELPKEGA